MSSLTQCAPLRILSHLVSSVHISQEGHKERHYTALHSPVMIFCDLCINQNSQYLTKYLANMAVVFGKHFSTMKDRFGGMYCSVKYIHLDMNDITAYTHCHR